MDRDLSLNVEQGRQAKNTMGRKPTAKALIKSQQAEEAAKIKRHTKVLERIGKILKEEKIGLVGVPELVSVPGPGNGFIIQCNKIAVVEQPQPQEEVKE